MIELNVSITARRCYVTQVSARIDTDDNMEDWEKEEILKVSRKIMAQLEEVFGHVGNSDSLEANNDEDC